MIGRLKACAATLAADRKGSVVVEFALVLPVIMGLFLGAMQIGLQMYSYNALRAIAADTARYTIVQYQTKTALTTSQIGGKAIALAVNPPYSLQFDKFDATVTNPNSNISGTKQFNLTITYVPISLLDFLHVDAPTITVTRPIYVAS